MASVEPMSQAGVAQISLDVDQAKAAASDGHCLIIAGPGSGKTRTLSARGMNLINRSGKAIAAVTFTRDAARELRDRIVAAGPSGCQKRIYAGTFHSLALHQLRMAKQAPKRIAAGAERRGYLRQARLDAGFPDLKLDEVEARIDAIKADPAPPPGKTEGVTGALVAAYTELLEQAGVSDFADLIRIALHGMREGRVPPLPVGTMLVDEAQDMDPVQYAWLSHHWDNGVDMTLVGDDDQSIYGWRQALGAKGMRSFQQATDATEIDIGTNYRCRPEVLFPAIRLIEHEPDRFSKPLQPDRAAGGSVTVKSADSRKQEAELVLAGIQAHGNLSECAVIARTNRQLDDVELALGHYQIPCTRAGGSSFWQSKGPAILVSLLRSLLDDHPAGVLHAMRMLGVYLPSSAPLTSSAVQLLRETEAGSNGARPNVARVASNLRPRFEEWRDQLKKKRINLAIRGAGRWLSRQLEDLEKSIDPATEALLQFQGSLGERLRFVSQAEDKSKNEGIGDAVTLVTCHGSKGREWPWVWVIANERGSFPMEDSPIGEERRLAYVAFTRAAEHLTLSYVPGSGPQSPFLVEARLIPE